MHPELLLLLGAGTEFLVLAVVLTFGLTVVCVLLGRMLTALRSLRDLRGQLEQLEELNRTVERWSGERQEVDLRRIEHGIGGLREAHGRFEETLLRLLETLQSEPSGIEVVPHAPTPPRADLVERITNRLLAQGYSRIEFVTRREDLAAIEDEGTVLVEARRDGVVHKGSVEIRGGRLIDLSLRPAYTMFP